MIVYLLLPHWEADVESRSRLEVKQNCLVDMMYLHPPSIGSQVIRRWRGGQDRHKPANESDGLLQCYKITRGPTRYVNHLAVPDL